MATLKFDAVLDNLKLISGFDEIQRKIHETANAASKEGDAIDDILSNIKSNLGMLAGGWSIGQFVNQMMQVRGEFQQTEMAFETMLGSKQKADELMKQMINTAATTPFGVTDVTNGAKQLLAFNVSAEKVNDTIIRLGDVAAGMGLRMSDMVMLYGTTIAKGRMDTQDLYQHLNRGIPIAEALAKVMGLDVNNAIAEVGKAIKAKKVDADTYMAAMQQMTAEGSKFGGLMAAQSQTITGRIETIKDGVEQMFNELGRSQEGVIGTGLDIAGKLVENWRDIGKAIGIVITAYGAYKAALIATVAIAKANVALKEAAAFVSLARSITSAKDAMALFNLVSSKNVLGLVVGLLASAAAYFSLFGDSVEDVNDTTKKFGKEANEASANVESLLAVVKTAKKDSQTYKDAVKELHDIYSNYDITLQQVNEHESNLTDVADQELQKRNELIEAIRTESLERQRANAITAATETYKGVINSSDSTLDKDLKDFGVNKEAARVAVRSAIDEDSLRAIYKAQEAVNQLDNSLTKSEDQKRALGAAMLALNNAFEESDNKIRGVAKTLGLSKEQTEELIEASHDYAKTMSNGLVTYDQSIAKINQASDAVKILENKTASAADSQKAIQRQLLQTSDDAHALKKKIQALMDEYGVNDITFRIKIDDVDIPKWMQNMDLGRLQELAASFASMAKGNKDKGAVGSKVNGKYFSNQQLVERAAAYSAAADQKLTQQEEKQKADNKKKQEEEENKKKREAEEKTKKQEAQRKAEDAARRRQQLAEETRSWNTRKGEDAQNASNSLDDLGAANIRNENERKREENRIEHEKNMQQIRAQHEEYQKAIYEHNKKLWEINNTDKTKSYEDTNEGKAGWKNLHISDDQLTIIDAAFEKEYIEYAKKQKENEQQIRDADLTAMRDYIEKYGTLQEQLLSLEEKYQDERQKILDSSDTDEQKQWQLRSLDAQHSADTSKMNFDIFKNTINWDELFNDMTSLTKAQLGDVKAKLTDIMQSGTLQLEQYKEVLNQIRAIDEEMNTIDSNPWRTEHSQERDRLEQNVTTSREAYSAAVNEQSSAKIAEFGMQELIAQILGEMGMTMKQQDITTASSSSIIGNVSAKYGADSKETKQVQDAFAKLAKSSLTVADSNQKVDAASKTLASDEQKLSNFTKSLTESLQGFIETMENVAKNLNDVPGLLGELGVDEDSDVSKGMGDIADAANSSMNAAKDFMTGNYVGAAMNGISAVKSLGSGLNTMLGLGIGEGNAKEVNEKIEKLTERNDLLIDAIDRLTDQLNETTGGMKSIKAAQEAMSYQEEKEANLKEIAHQRAGYTAAHHSWNYNWGGFTDEQIAKFSEKIGRDWNGDIWDLNTSEIADLLATPDMVERIKNTGNGGYAAAFLNYLNAWADEDGKMDDIADTLKEKLTQTTFDSLRSDFISTLMDMESDAADFSDKFTEMLMQSVLNTKMADLLDDEMQEFYDKWSEYAESDGELTQAEIAELRANYDTLTAKALELRDQASQITGYEGSDSDADSSTGAWSSLGEETGRALEGRFAALQIQTTKIADVVSTDIANNLLALQSLTSAGVENNKILSDMRDQLMMSNSYLEDIAAYNKGIYNDFSKRLDNMYNELRRL